MTTNIIISDTSCLISLQRIRHLFLLQRLFSTVHLTKEVATEFGEDLPNWIEINAVQNIDLLMELNQQIDTGEASAIALETKNSILIIDESRGRKVAINYRVEIMGTLQILLLAKRKGIINSIKEVLTQLERNNSRFSEKLKNELLEKAGEK